MATTSGITRRLLHSPPVALTRLFRAAALASALAYLLGISWYLLTHGGWPTPDYLVPPLLLLAIALGRGWAFVLDWGPFLLLVLSWQATAGIADQLGRPVHFYAPAEADFRLFGGHLPTVALQAQLFDPARAHWYDWAATLQHALHFVLPVVVGLAIWLRSRRVYWRYLASVIVLFYLGFVLYALYPAAPPWLAGLYGVIPPVERVAIATVQRLPAGAPIGLAYNHFNANQVAAIPSLHAALPMLLALVLVRIWGWRALPLILYPLTMGFNLVYLGEHYVIDVLLGYIVALVAFALVWVVPEVLPLHLPRFRWAAPHLRVPRAARLAGDLTLPAVALASLAVIGFSLRPDRPSDTTGPVIPGLQVQAGHSDAIAPAPCDEGASSSLTADQILTPVAERYAVYLFDVDDSSCYVLSANASFAPPLAARVPALAARAPVQLAPLSRRRGTVEYYALHTGQPMPDLVQAGLPADHHYLVVVALGGVPDAEAAAVAADTLVSRAIVIESAP